MGLNEVTNTAGIVEYLVGFVFLALTAWQPNFYFRKVKIDSIARRLWFRLIVGTGALFCLVQAILTYFGMGF